jgi:hypothetical protein
MTIRLGLISLLVAAAACDSGVNKPFGGLDNGMMEDGFVFKNGDMTGGNVDLSSEDAPGFGNVDLAMDVNGPTITITSPKPTDEVHYDTLTVTATIVGKGGAFIDGNNVFLTIPSGGVGGTKAPMTLTAMQDVYQGSIDISAIPSGTSQFIVSAADVMGRQNSVEQNYIHDHGPVITFIQPTAPTATGSLYVEVLINDTLHPLADAGTVKATIHAGDNIVLTAISGAVPLRVNGTIKFSDYSPPLDGLQLLTVSATNSAGTVGRGTKQFTVDNVGPTIKITNPLPGQFIAGVIQITANIDDISGVSDGSVVAVFGNDLSKSVPMTRTLPNMPQFQGLFDVRQLGVNYVLPTLSVRADDNLGNHSELAEDIAVDNVPPFMSMDPPLMYVANLLTGNIVQCGQPFDPVGDDAANDLQTVPQVITLRARIEDSGNFAPGLSHMIWSGVDTTSVYLYGISASGEALAVDTDGDGQCDDVNPLLVPTTNITASGEAVSLQLASIPPGGAADLTPSPTPTPSPTGCDEIGALGGVTPPPLCLGVANLHLPIAIGYGDNNDPAIWTIPPVVASRSGCVGFQFDSANKIPEGPACFVVVAKDNAGNHNVTTPLRVCIERSSGHCPSGWENGITCRGTYNKATNMTDPNTPCSPAPSFTLNGADPRLLH